MNKRIKAYRCKYEDGFGNGCVYYSFKPEGRVLDKYEIDKQLLIDEKHNFGNVDDLIKHCVKAQKYLDELDEAGI